MNTPDNREIAALTAERHVELSLFPDIKPDRQGGSQHGRLLPMAPPGFMTWNYLDAWRGMIDTYDAGSGDLISSRPVLGGPFDDYGPTRWDYEQITRPERIRQNILKSLPPGRPGGFIRAAR